MNAFVLTPRGNTYVASEYEEWLAKAGFRGVEVVPIPEIVSHVALARSPG